MNAEIYVGTDVVWNAGGAPHELNGVPPVGENATGAALVARSGGSVRSKFENGKTMIRSIRVGEV